MRVRILALVLISMSICSSAESQTRRHPAKAPEPEVVDDTLAPKPSPEMLKLRKWFVGTWTTTEKHEPNDLLPNGGTGIGKEVIRVGPGGLMLISDYNSTGSMGKFSGHGIFYWDEHQKAYASFWCDNMNPVCEPAGTGNWDEDDLLFRGETGPTAERVKTLQRYSRIGSDSFLYELSVADESGVMRKSMTVEYRRVK